MYMMPELLHTLPELLHTLPELLHTLPEFVYMMPEFVYMMPEFNHHFPIRCSGQVPNSERAMPPSKVPLRRSARRQEEVEHRTIAIDGIAPNTFIANDVTLDGMKAHNRRLALEWPFGNPAAPIMKFHVPSDAVQELIKYASRNRGVTSLPLVSDEGIVKAKLKGFGSYGNTQRIVDHELQKKGTLLIDKNLKPVIAHLPGLGTIVQCVLEHARQWYAHMSASLAPALLLARFLTCFCSCICIG